MREACEVVLHIEQFGSTRSINAGAAAAIAMHAWVRRHVFDQRLDYIAAGGRPARDKGRAVALFGKSRKKAEIADGLAKLTPTDQLQVDPPEEDFAVALAGARSGDPGPVGTYLAALRRAKSWDLRSRAVDRIATDAVESPLDDEVGPSRAGRPGRPAAPGRAAHPAGVGGPHQALDRERRAVAVPGVPRPTP